MNVYECNGTTILYNLYKDSNYSTNLKEKALKKDFSPQKIQTARPTLRRKYYAYACVMLNAPTAPAAFAQSRVSHVVFLISLVLQQNSRDCIGNTNVLNTLI